MPGGILQKGDKMTDEEMRVAIITGTYENPTLALPTESEITSFPFVDLSEISQAGVKYGTEAYNAMSNVVQSVVGSVSETIKPSGSITSDFDWKKFFSNFTKIPYIFIPLGIAAFWIYSVMKKRG
jgi:hypothetical protein